MVLKINFKRIDSLRSLLIILLIVLITMAVYHRVLRHEFLNYDDNVYITENDRVAKGLTKDGVIWAFKTTYAANWHPLTWISHMIDSELFGLDPAGHHFVNLLFHLANSIILFIVLKSLTQEIWKSGFLAAFFAIHPLHIESVAWVAERKDVLSAFLGLLTIWIYISYVRRPHWIRYLLFIFTYLLGVLAKPMVVTLPFVLLLLDYWPLARFRFGDIAKITRNKWGKNSFLITVAEKAPMFLLSIISSGITFFAQKKGGTVADFYVMGLGDRIANALLAYVTYLWKTIWPNRLAVLYPFPAKGIPILSIIGSLIVLVFITITVVRKIGRYPFLSVGWFWYLGMLVPVIGIIQVGKQSIALRYTYLPHIGLFIFLIWGADVLIASFPIYRKSLSYIGCICLLVYGVISWQYLGKWENSIDLYEQTISVTTNNYVIHYNLGNALVYKSDIRKAIDHYKKAIEINPLFVRPYVSLGNSLAETGQQKSALSEYKKAIAIKPDYAEAYFNLGQTYYELDDYNEAVKSFLKALELKLSLPEVYFNLGNAYNQLDHYHEAVENYKKAISIRPDYVEAYCNLVMVYLSMGRVEDAEKELITFQKLDPGTALYLRKLIQAYYKQ